MKFDRLTMFPNYKINQIRKIKPKLPTFVIVLGCLVIIFITFIFSDFISPNQATVLGVAGSTMFAITVFFLSSSKEENQKLAVARNSARVLAQILDHISNELTNVSEGNMYQINYPQNWLSLYTEIASYLEYDYLGALIKEFAFIDMINEIILKGDVKLAKSRISRHWEFAYASWHDFCISDINFNLYQFSAGQKERAHWTSEKRYRDFYDNFIRNFSEKVHSLTIAFLKEHGNAGEERPVADFVMSEIKKDSNFIRLFDHVSYNRELLLAIFHIHLDAEANSIYALCWGQLSLKDETEQSC